MTDVPAKDAMEAGSEAGFTLVELLVALALFSLLATLLFGNVHFGLHVWRSGSVHAEQFERSLISQDLLRRTIGNLYPMAVMKEGNQPQIVFDGTKGAVVFLSNAPTVAAAGGRFRYKIFVERRLNSPICKTRQRQPRRCCFPTSIRRHFHISAKPERRRISAGTITGKNAAMFQDLFGFASPSAQATPEHGRNC